MSVTKDIWGPAYWYKLHMIAINYPYNPTRDKAASTAQDVFYFVKNLPCEECRQHASEYIHLNPIHLGSSYTFQSWVFEFHNSVNRRLGKREITYGEYTREYERELTNRELNIF
jgi:FAD-linked sulfhydryl oxidase